MKVRVQLFAALRDELGSSCVTVDITAPGTVGQLRQTLLRQYPALGRWARQLTFAVDRQYAREEDAVTPDSDVACFPPVSGG